MAAGFVNSITLIGNLTRDPELRFTTNGTPVASFSVAVNKRVQSKESGEWVNDADFFNVVAWFKLAENLAASLNKGDRVIVIGRLAQQNWDDKQGQKRTEYKVIANIVAPSLEFATCKIEKNVRPGVSLVSIDDVPEEIEGDGIDFSGDDIPF